MAIVRWEPLREISSLQNEMNRLFNTVFDAPQQGGNGGNQVRRWVPAMDLVETDAHFVLRADLPGLTRGGRRDRARGQRPDPLGRAQGRARGEAGGLLPRRARLRPLLALPHAAQGHRPRGRDRLVHQRRARGPDPQARGAQAAQDLDRGGRQPARDRGQRVLTAAARAASRRRGPVPAAGSTARGAARRRERFARRHTATARRRRAPRPGAGTPRASPGTARALPPW